MEKIKEKIRSYFDIGFYANLDSFTSEELEYINNYMTRLIEYGRVYKICELTNDDEKLGVQVKTGTYRLKK